MWSKNSDKRDTLFPRSEDAVFASPCMPPAPVPKITDFISDIAESSRELSQAAKEQAWKEESDNHFLSFISPSQGEPWSKYQHFMIEEQAGRKTVAYSNNITFDLVAIREWKLFLGDTLDRLRKTSHSNIVNLKEVYQSGETLFLVYENMDTSHVSLENIEDNPSESLNEFEITALCKQASSPTSHKNRNEVLIHEVGTE
ncbi:hypothetical protein BDBG_06430 [Blastomyces gilchristii SLH14081]|uniref:Protein kinase domain-containing protein n=1 Tax=Blastomyces gilchristii (strain SLH14081) TaxID=559298 RepID=A0A179UW30_BLAGS|nr:uncharacterized protein BDBG_06430 [Blastomyces gilchristii SLH14081]OAT10612.1 hypothetical protein BDBG_06430 [Blastomyces gilchristii SLH14081]